MSHFSPVLALLLVACGGPRGPAPVAHRSASVADHETAAENHERRADEIEARQRPEREVTGAPGMQCVDQPLAGVPETGGKPINVLRPCWTAVLSPTEQDKRDADQHRQQAAEHRAAAAALIGAERQHCRGMGELELSTSPFWHRRDIAAVREVREQSVLRGAAVQFRAVPGLTAEWLERAAECHHARAAVLGHPPTFMAYCPLALPAVDIEVRTASGGLELIVTSARSDIAAAVLGRARDLQPTAASPSSPAP